MIPIITKIYIPVCVARNGEIQTGSASVDDKGVHRKSHDWAQDGFSDQVSGGDWRLIYVEADIDVAKIFADQTLQGDVKCNSEG